MRIKLDTFQVNGESYNDQTPYTIANPLGKDDEMYVTDQQVFSDLTIYYSNAFHILGKLKKTLNIREEVGIDPANLQMSLKHEKEDIGFGFSPGDSDFLEPYFFIRTYYINVLPKSQTGHIIGIPHSKDWSGFVFAADDFMKTDADQEYKLVYDFFTHNAEILLKSGSNSRTQYDILF
jgi:hypothetical protein